MFSSKGAFAALALVASASAAATTDKVAEAALVQKLRLAPVATDRISLLTTDDQFTFDFFAPDAPATKGAGGRIVTANAGNFPAIIGQGSAMAVGFLEPCSLNTPHTHPRATEIQISMNATIRTGMITENGARFVMTELPPGSMTIFPMGSIHFQVNDGCDPALFVSGFNSEDPGVLSIAQRFLGLPPDILSATLGDLGVEEVVGLEAQIPDNVAIGTDACLQRCGLQRPTQPTTQQQPIVSGNAAPSGISSWTANTATAAPSVPTSSSGQPVNHLIKVGADGLNYTPSNITAAPGDTVTFEFHPKNHTVTQSSFPNPCKALDKTSTTGQVGFKSGFVFVPPNATTFPTFTITINDTTPIWGYCGQQGPPVHCTSGMVFSINAVESGPNNFAAFKQLAMDSGTAASASASLAAASGVAVAKSGDLLAAVADNGNNSGSSSTSNKFSPALIALLAINGVLFIGLIVIGVMYIRKHRAAARVARHRQLYTSIGATGEPIFVANEKMERHPPTTTGRAVRAAPTESEDDEASQGLTHGPYYDPHEQKGFYDGPEPRPTR